MEKYYKVAKFFAIFIAIIIIIVCSIYNYSIGPVDKNAKDIVITIEENSTYLTIAEQLKEKKLIRSIKFYKVYIKIFNPKNLYAGKYILNGNMGVKKLVGILSHEVDYNPEEVIITFREGLNIRQITNLITKNTNNKEEDIYSLLKDQAYLKELKETYWFITDDILNKDLYYSLEGYLFPNTYRFINKGVTIKEIFKEMLDEMNNKLLPHKETIISNKYSIHQLLTLASLVELEVSNIDDRKDVAGVFFNRLANEWTLGSDVTTYYAEKIDVWTGLNKNQLQACNKYNTRGLCVKGLPIGPICNPSLESIEAVINPSKHKYFYFVADCQNKNYFTNNQNEHDNMIKKLKAENNWCE